MRIICIILLIISLVTSAGFSQNLEKFNLGFEVKKDQESLADGWFKWGESPLSLDSNSYTGKYSGLVSSSEEGASFGAIVYRIPAGYKGKQIKLRGYIKTENIIDGYAGLLLRIDKKNNVLAFDNMENRPVKGTSGWKVYEIILPYAEESDAVYVGGILVGKGKAWFDDFEITIDGIDIQNLTKQEKKTFKADLDKEFEKGSGILLEKFKNIKIENLSLLCQIWGFLKYHHPAISKGDYNWDFELFRLLPSFIKQKSKKDRDKLLINWIESFGPLKNSIDYEKTPSNAYLKPDLSWIYNQEEQLKTVLEKVYINRNTGDNYYVDFIEGVGNPVFMNEKAYKNLAYPDDGYRLLAIFRYWNIINYFFPYKYLVEKDWNDVLDEYIPLFIQARDELAYELTTLQLISEINDSHAKLIGAVDKIWSWKGKNFPLFRTTFIDGMLIVKDFLSSDIKENSGLSIGDIIHSINGVSINEIVKNRLKYYPASNKNVQLRDISKDILRSNQDSIIIEYSSKDMIKRSKKILLYPSDYLRKISTSRKEDTISFELLEEKIGYINLKKFKSNDISTIKKEFMNTKGIIIDLRNYPADFVAIPLGSIFVSGTRPFAKLSIGSISNPGYFTFTENLTIKNEGEHYKGHVILLVDEQTISQGEFTAMVLQAGLRTTVIGGMTAGTDGNVSTFVLPGGLETSFSGVGVYYPDGTATQRIGIVPDINVAYTIEGVRAGKDEVLHEAIKFIHTN